jgi:hypothetical protein
VRELRLVHHVTDASDRSFWSPEGGSHEHLRQEGTIRSISWPKNNRHASSCHLPVR